MAESASPRSEAAPITEGDRGLIPQAQQRADRRDADHIKPVRPQWSQLVYYLTLRELRSRYKRTALGWGWSLLNPMFTAVVLSAVFGGIFLVTAPIGDPSGLSAFTIYVLNGLLVWNMFAISTNNSMGIILNSAGLIQKVDFPRSSLVWSAVFSSTITLLIEFAVLVALIWAFGGRGFPSTLYMIVPFIILLTTFCVGVGLFLSTANVYFRDINHLYQLFLTAWFYLTPVIYSRDIIPEEVEVIGIDVPLKLIVDLNPMTHFVTAARTVLYDFSFPTLSEWGILALLAGGALSVGGLIFGHFEKRFAEEL